MSPRRHASTIGDGVARPCLRLSPLDATKPGLPAPKDQSRMMCNKGSESPLHGARSRGGTATPSRATGVPNPCCTSRRRPVDSSLGAGGPVFVSLGEVSAGCDVGGTGSVALSGRATQTRIPQCQHSQEHEEESPFRLETGFRCDHLDIEPQAQWSLVPVAVDGLLAVGTDGDDAHADASKLLEEVDVVLGLARKLVEVAHVRDIALPAG